MLDTEGFITKIREILEETTEINKAYSPDLPQEKDNIVAITLLTGTQDYNLCKTDVFYITFRVLFRGTSDDKNSRRITDQIYNELHLNSNVFFNESKIIQILANNLPSYVGRDEEMRVLYNTTFVATVKGE